MTVSDLLAHLHDLRMGIDDDPPDHGGTTDHGDRNDEIFQHAAQEEESPILVHLTKRKEIPPGNLRRVRSKTMSHAKKPPTNNINDEITIDGLTFIN